jgi:hypothetical protein
MNNTATTNCKHLNYDEYAEKCDDCDKSGLAIATEIMDSRGCDYYDHTEKTLEQWRERLETSEVNDYSFLSNNVAQSSNGAILKYLNHMVSTWMVR